MVGERVRSGPAGGTAAGADAHATDAASLLRPGRNVWRVAQADRVAVLSNGASYFGTLRQVLREARSSIQIVGWDIDSRTRLVGPSGEPEDGLPATLAAFLAALVQRRPELSVRLLLWDYSVLYALERETLPALNLRWSTPPQIELCLDDLSPFGASHHQKLVVVDDCVAFAGGLDLTIRRWDTAAHAPGNPHRVDPRGRPYPPFHDVQMMVDGAAAAALGELARERWSHAACESVPPPELPARAGDPWPPGLVPDLRNVGIGIARTAPGGEGRSEIREVEALFADMLGAARRTILIENQFLTSEAVCRALCRALCERPALEAVIVAPRTHHTWLEHRTMLAGRIRFMQRIRGMGLGERVRLVFPEVHGAEVMVHAKVLVVDDDWLRIGSANLCNRSMGTDTECDLVVAARTEADRAGIARVRHALLAEHLGSTPEQVAAAEARTGSLFAAIDALNTRRRGLRPIKDGPLAADEAVPVIEAAADPERPLAPAEFLADLGLLPEQARVRRITGRTLRGWLGWGAALLVPLVLAALLWRYTSLSSLMKPGAVQTMLHAGGSWGPLLALGLFLLLGLVAFPVNVLIVGTAAAFGTWPGLAYAAGGALLSAALTFLVGRWLGPGVLRRFAGPRVNRIRQSIGRNGIMAVTLVRLMPVAPFTLVNLVAGAVKIRFLDYMLGTALGLLPGIALMTALGDRLWRIVAHPSVDTVADLLLVLLAWGALTWGVQKLVRRARHED